MNDKNERNLDQKQDSEESHDTYQFLHETYKKRPADPKAVARVVIYVLLLAVAAGAVGGLVFRAVVSRTIREAGHISFAPGQTAAADSGLASSDESASSSDSSSSGNTPAGSGALTEEQQEEKSLVDYEALNRKMEQIGEAASASLVQVTGVSTTEDWLKSTGENAVTQTGLVVADSGSAYLVLVDHTRLSGVQRTVVAFSDGSMADASVIKTDPVTKLSVLSVPYENLSQAARSEVKIAVLGNSYALSSGETVVAIGSPLGYSSSVAYGAVTSTDTMVSVTDGAYRMLVTDIKGSSSGSGFLINTSGEIVGMILQKYASRNPYVVTSLPISMLKSLIETLSNDQGILYLGIHGETISEAVQKNSGVPEGVYVTSVDQDSPALKAGLVQGDIIVRFDGIRVESMMQLHNRLETLEEGDTVKVTVMRQGSEGYVQFHFEMTVGAI